MRFNPPPNWPTPSPGWSPPPGWEPPAEWGPAPHGWPLWVDDRPLTPMPQQVIVQQAPKSHGFRTGCLSVIALLIVIGAIGAAIGNKKKTNSPTLPVVPAQVASQSALAVPSFSEPAPPVDENTAHPPIEDVALNGCTVDASTGWPSCNVLIINRSSKTSNYVVTVSLLSADDKTKYGDMIATVDGLAPGQSSPQTAQGFVQMPPGGHAVITDVQRYAS